MKLKRSFLLIACACLSSFTWCFLALVTLFALPQNLASAESPAFVRIVHASPDVGTADVFLDGTKLLNTKFRLLSSAKVSAQQ